MKLNFNQAEFIKSAVSLNDFPDNPFPQIVFAGKSNVGKSSVINRILNRRNFARVGASPGKTTHINYFLIDRRAYLVDLPGYGYAKVSKTEKERWGKLIEEYFSHEKVIDFGVLIVDARHKPTADDVIMAEWFSHSGVRFCVAANKSDKLKKSELESAVSLISETLNVPENRIILFSAEKGTGREVLLREISGAINAIGEEE